jgi:hypothetical protein
MRSFILVKPNEPRIEKDVEASLTYGIDISDVTEVGAGAVSQVAADPTGVSITGQAVADGYVLLVKVSGGQLGDANSVRFTWRLANGDADGRTIYFRVFKR